MDATMTRRSERSVERATYPACSSPPSSRLASVPTIPARRATVDTRCGPPRSSTPRMPIPGAETSTPARAARRRAAITLDPARPMRPIDRSICSSASARRTRRAYRTPCGESIAIPNIVPYLRRHEGNVMGRLEKRVAVVTGGGDGIGAGIARRFAEEGARVVIAELDERRGRATAEELTSATGAETLFVHTDVRRKEDNVDMIGQAVDAWGTVDILVN